MQCDECRLYRDRMQVRDVLLVVSAALFVLSVVTHNVPGTIPGFLLWFAAALCDRLAREGFALHRFVHNRPRHWRG